MSKVFQYLQNIGKSLMVPVAVLPAAAILMGVGYWIDPTGWGENSQAAAILIKAGSALIDNMGILFAIGVGFGLSKDKNGAAALSALVGWLIIQQILNPDNLALIQGKDVADIPLAFTKVNNQFVGILTGVVSSTVYNRTYQVELPPALAFFSGRRLSSIVTAVAMLIVSGLMMFVWPVIFDGLVAFGEYIMDMGAIGAGIYGFCNRMLIPVGLHHALNSVFWFDVAGINDIANFYSAPGTANVDIPNYTVGMYQAGFFPIMMGGLPGAAIAMYHEALPNQKKAVYGLLIGGAVASFFTGVTEPLEFSFMFAAPALYAVHAVFTGISVFIAAQMHWISGFGFSAGFVDFFLSSKNPNATQWYMLIPMMVAFFALYYFSFRFLIRKFNLSTPGREDIEMDEEEQAGESTGNKHEVMAKKIYDAIGHDNLKEVDNCATRLRLIVGNSAQVDEAKIKQTGVAGVLKPTETTLQIIVGPSVQFVADELTKLNK